ncbi:hypothetical protein RhiirA1_403603 [Rhizophagus irregularis]|uniref:Uncharacterized protein n=1 Tax=Rhizophagus irregularis TaxID=588596 RepID=A0A2I1FFW3_9GLOM|nr:hypothetical protein RhiirA1_403603 [Rhizophagus irregularis]PKY33282.1 hypothetical protein RhiirB3_394678 [Rhizophagus irregularis]
MATLLYYSDDFDITYEGVRSFKDIEILKIIENSISKEEIVKNMHDLKSKLKEKSSQLAVEMRQLLEKVNIDNLIWQKLLAIKKKMIKLSYGLWREMNDGMAYIHNLIKMNLGFSESKWQNITIVNNSLLFIHQGLNQTGLGKKVLQYLLIKNN